MYRKISPRGMMFRYLVTNFGLVLLACAFVCFFLYQEAVSGIIETQKRITGTKLTEYVQYLDNEYDTMSEVSYNLCVQRKYWKATLERGSYYELEMLNDLHSYTGKSQLADSFFLVYHDSDWVYKSNGRKVTYDLFILGLGILDDPIELRGVLSETDGFRVRRISLSDGSALLFLFPIYCSTAARSHGATLAFLVTESRLLKRFEELEGTIDGNLWINCANVVMQLKGTGDPSTYDAEPNSYECTIKKDGGIHYTSVSPSGRFTLQLDAPAYRIYGNESLLTWDSVIFLAILLVVMLTVSVVMAYRDYEPLRKLTRKVDELYQGSRTSAPENELEYIASTIETLLDDKRETEANLRCHYELIRQQIFRLLLSGDERYAGYVRESFMGIRLGPFYAAVRLHFRDKQPSTTILETLSALIEELSTEDTHLYYAEPCVNGTATVLIGLPDEDALTDALDMLAALLDTTAPCTLNATTVCHDVRTLREAYKRLCTAEVLMDTSPETTLVSDPDNRWQEKPKAVWQDIAAEIQATYADPDMSLDKLAERMSLSGKYISRLLKEGCGLTYKDLLTETRIDAACSLLCVSYDPDHEETVSEICRLVGYRNISLFIKNFKRLRGVTPAQWRLRKQHEMIAKNTQNAQKE